ncbi:hypothetical protein [Streptomyces sp. NPDC003688]
MSRTRPAWSGVDLEARRRRYQDGGGTPTVADSDEPAGMAQEFRLGLAGGRAGADTGRADEPEDDVSVVTPQLLEKLGALTRSCPECHHTFRLGEEVTVEHTGTGDEFLIRHRNQLLGCRNPDGSQELTRMAAEFHEGLDDANPPPPDLHPVRLDPGHELLRLHPGTASGSASRYRCWVCGDSLRPKELVIHCTCSPHDPQCRCAVHLDPDRGRMCFDDWKSAHGGTVPCLMRNAPKGS